MGRVGFGIPLLFLIIPAIDIKFYIILSTFIICINGSAWFRFRHPFAASGTSGSDNSHNNHVNGMSGTRSHGTSNNDANFLTPHRSGQLDSIDGRALLSFLVLVLGFVYLKQNYVYFLQSLVWANVCVMIVIWMNLLWDHILFAETRKFFNQWNINPVDWASTMKKTHILRSCCMMYLW